MDQNDDYYETNEGAKVSFELFLFSIYTDCSYKWVILYIVMFYIICLIFIFSTLRDSFNVYARANSMDDRNRKVTWNILILCFCYVLCTMPHVIHSYLADTFDQNGDHLYDVLLGVYWLQYGFNIGLYVGQRAQYWNAYKLYAREQILPMFYQPTPEERASVSSPHYVKTGSTKNYFFYNF